MQNAIDVIIPNTPTVSEAEAQRAANDYVAAHIDPSFAVVSGAQVKHRASGRTQWQFIIRCEHGPLYPIYVDAKSGTVTPLADNEIQMVREKAAIFVAREQGKLPVDERGYILAEYARRQADSYLGDQIAMYFNATDPVFVPGDPPCWRVTIVLKMYDIGPIPLGTLAVNPRTGEPIPLTAAQIQKIKAHAHAFVEFQTQTAATPR